MQMKKSRRLRRGGNVECVIVRVHDDHGHVEAGSTFGPRGLERRSTGTGARVSRMTGVRSSCHSRNVRRVVRETPNMYIELKYLHFSLGNPSFHVLDQKPLVDVDTLETVY